MRVPSDGNATHIAARRAFAAVLVELRFRRGLTQDKLALRSGYTQKYISLLERAKFSPSLTALLELAAALDTSAAELVRRVEEILPRDLKRRNTQRRANSTHPNKSD